MPTAIATNSLLVKEVLILMAGQLRKDDPPFASRCNVEITPEDRTLCVEGLDETYLCEVADTLVCKTGPLGTAPCRTTIRGYKGSQAVHTYKGITVCAASIYFPIQDKHVTRFDAQYRPEAA